MNFVFLKQVIMLLFERLQSGWTGLKVLRIILGGLILYSSISEGHVTGVVLGGLFILISLFTNGVCCSGAGCQLPVKNDPSQRPENTEYEELAHK